MRNGCGGGVGVVGVEEGHKEAGVDVALGLIQTEFVVALDPQVKVD